MLLILGLITMVKKLPVSYQWKFQKGISSRCTWAPIYICMYVCFYLQWLQCCLCVQDHSCLQNRKPMLKIVLYWLVYGHVIIICLPSLEKVTLVNVFIYINFFFEVFIALYNQVKKAQQNENISLFFSLLCVCQKIVK